MNVLEAAVRRVVQERRGQGGAYQLAIEPVPGGVLVRATSQAMSPGAWNELRKVVAAAVPEGRQLRIESGAGYGWSRLTFTLAPAHERQGPWPEGGGHRAERPLLHQIAARVGATADAGADWARFYFTTQSRAEDFAVLVGGDAQDVQRAHAAWLVTVPVAELPAILGELENSGGVEAICRKCDRPFDVTEEYAEICDRCDDDWGRDDW